MVFTFVAGAVETMSHEVVPYLLTCGRSGKIQKPKWSTLSRCFDSFLNYRSIIEENARLEEVGSLYFDVIKHKN